jgi:hypothetical protein
MNEPTLYEFFGGPKDGTREPIPPCEDGEPTHWVICRDAPTGDMAIYEVDQEARCAELLRLVPGDSRKDS